MSRIPSAARVASFMPKSMRAAYDIAVRVYGLEEIAGLPARSWPPDRRGLMMAAEHFGGQISPQWVSLQEQGIAEAVERKAHDKLSSEDAEELVSRVLSGMSVPSNPRGQAGAAAKKVKSRVLRGEPPHKTFKNMFIAHTAMRAADINKRENYRGRERGHEVNLGEPNSPDGDSLREVSRSDTLDKGDVFLSDNPMVSRWIQSELSNWRVDERVREAVQAFFADPGRGKQTDLAREYGVSKPSIKKWINKGIEYLTEQVRHDPRILSKLHLMEEGQSLSRMASKSRVAALWVLTEHFKRIAGLLEE